MNFIVFFHVILQTPKDIKARKLINMLQEELGYSLSDINLKPYWKIESQYEGNFYLKYENDLEIPGVEWVHFILEEVNNI
ncbi:hypothetical protein D3C81_1836100 [compost metagenome]